MRAWAQIDLGALRSNIRVISTAIGRTVDVMAVVKSDAYGHGLAKVVQAIDSAEPIKSYAVNELGEANTIRTHSDKDVLILGYLDTKELLDAIENDYLLSVYDREQIGLVERAASKLGKRARVQLKVETGLQRLGLALEEAEEFLLNTQRYPQIKVEAVFSHLAKSDNTEQSRLQLRNLQDLVTKVSGRTEPFAMHIASSYSLGHFKEGYLDAVRLGLALYGIDEVLPGLTPSFSAKAMVMQVKTVEAGEGISYGHLYTSSSQMQTAVVNIGYADGLSQFLRDKLTILIQGREVPVVGQICMNHVIADVTGVDARRGDEVVVIGTQTGRDGARGEIKVSDLAKRAGIRHHEIVLRMGTALPRIYV